MASANGDRVGFINEHGWWLYRGMITPDTSARAVRWLESTAERAAETPALEPEFEEEPVDGRYPLRKLRRILWNDEAFWIPLLDSAGLIDLGRSLVGGETVIIRHAAFLKPGMVGSEVAFHQDQVLWGKQQYPGAVMAWIALAPCRPENGCLQVCPGSHRLGPVPHREQAGYEPGVSAASRIGHPFVVPGEDGVPEPIDVVMDPGDVLVWHRYMVHGSRPNQSRQARTSMVLAFADASAPGFAAKDVYRCSSLATRS